MMTSGNEGPIYSIRKTITSFVFLIKMFKLPVILFVTSFLKFSLQIIISLGRITN